MNLLPGTRRNRKSVFIKAILATLCAAVLGFAAPALHASSITYNLTLTPGNGSLYGGTGTITVSSAAPATGQVDYTQANGKLLDVDLLHRRPELLPCRSHRNHPGPLSQRRAERHHLRRDHRHQP